MKKEITVALLLMLHFLYAQAQTPFLLHDINTITGSCNFGDKFVQINDALIFRADNQNGFGSEIWKVNPSTQEAEMLKDIYPGLGGSLPNQLTGVGNHAFFTARNSPTAISSVLYRTDGSAAGTLAIGNDIVADKLAAREDTLFFLTQDNQKRVLLWKLEENGTTPELLAQTSVNRRINSTPVFLHNLAFFVTETSPGSNSELWRSDGTANGTFRIKSVESWKKIENLSIVNNRLLFWTGGDSLWATSTGFPGGNVLLKAFSVESAGTKTIYATQSETALFWVRNEGSSREFWKTDGTPEGTILLDDAAPAVTRLVYAKGKIYAAGYKLWMSYGDGPFAQIIPSQALGFTVYPDGMLFANGYLYFTAFDLQHGREPWISDGSSQGTRRIRDLHPAGGSSSPFPRAELFGGRVLWTAQTAEKGEELWISDVGGDNMTFLVDVNDNTNSSSPAYLSLAQDKIFLSAYDGVHGTELWGSDLDGQSMTLYDISPGSNYGSPSSITYFEGSTYFSGHTANYQADLFYIENNMGGATPFPDLVAPDPQGYSINTKVCNGKLFFNGSDQLYTLNPDGSETLILPHYDGFYADICHDNTLYFATSDGSLYKSDGTVDGTKQIIKFTASTSENVYLGDITPFNGALYFSVLQSGTGGEIWKTDGSAQNTQRLLDLPSKSISDLIVLKDKLIFIRQNLSNSYEIWATDGSESGTYPVKTGLIAYPHNLTVLGDWVYFTIRLTTSTTHSQLYKTSASPAETYLILESSPDVNNMAMIAVGDKLFFTGGDPEHGAELWVTDPISDETKLFADICPGECSSSPYSFVLGDSYLYFNAYHTKTGFEPWALALSAVHVNALSRTEQPKLTLLSNPLVGERLRWSITLPAKMPLHFALYDLQGKNIWRQEDTLDAGLNIREVALNNLPNGIYVLEALGDFGKLSQKVLVGSN